MLNIGVIGTGFGRYVHIRGFTALDSAKVLGVASGKYENAITTAKQYGIAHAFESWQDLIECGDIHAVSIATPPHLHEEITLKAIEARKSILCEKPMAMNAGQCERMLKAAESAAIVHAVDFQFREIPAFRFAKQLLEKGVLGEVRHVQIDWITSNWADPARPWTWRSDKSRGGGALATLGVHVFDYIEWLFSPITAVYARLNTHIIERRDLERVMRPVETEDSCHLILDLESGAVVSVSISTVAPLGIGHRIEIFGEKKSLLIKNEDLSDYCKGFQVWEGEIGSGEFKLRTVPQQYKFPIDFEDGRLASFVSLAGKFVRAVLKREVADLPSFYDGLKARQCMDLAYESAATHQAAVKGQA